MSEKHEQLKLLNPANQPMKFDGPDYDEKLDQARLTGQIHEIFKFMVAGKWQTLKEIEAATKQPAASISARLRDFRKPRFGGHKVEKRRRHGEQSTDGVWEYRLVINDKEA